MTTKSNGLVKLYPEQQKAIDALGNGNILKGEVGSGKTITSLGYYMQKEAPKDVYVITTAKKRDSKDWEDDAAKYRIGHYPMGDQTGALVVDSWNNLGRYEKVDGAFFIFDEQRLVGSGAWVKAFLKITKNNTWLLLSATPGDTWLDYIPVFIANGFVKNRSEFLEKYVVFDRFSKYPKVKKYILEPKLERLRASITVEMQDNRHTKRHVEWVTVPHEEKLLERVFKDRWNVYEERPLRDVAELFRVARKVVNSDPARLLEIERIAQKHEKLIIFYNFNYELEMLRELKDWLDIPMAEWNGHKHEPIPEGDRWIYLVQYTAGAEGWNCVETNAMIFYSLNYSYKIFEQAQGRIDRMNTPYTDLQYYILWSNSFIDKAIAKSVTAKKAFNEVRFWKALTSRASKAA